MLHKSQTYRDIVSKKELKKIIKAKTKCNNGKIQIKEKISITDETFCTAWPRNPMKSSEHRSNFMDFRRRWPGKNKKVLPQYLSEFPKFNKTPRKKMSAGKEFVTLRTPKKSSQILE